MLRQEHDLTNVVCVVRELPVDGLHDGMRLAANDDRLTEILRYKWSKCIENAAPTLLPAFKHSLFCVALLNNKLSVAIAVWLFPIRSYELFPTRSRISRQVLH